MGPMPHTITPDLDLMSPIGQKPVNADLGTYAMASLCETCSRPVLCLSWPLKSWRHVADDDLALLAELAGDGESAE